jgi:hypothetical protein
MGTGSRRGFGILMKMTGDVVYIYEEIHMCGYVYVDICIYVFD